jgi:hypothetical protein
MELEGGVWFCLVPGDEIFSICSLASGFPSVASFFQAQLAKVLCVVVKDLLLLRLVWGMILDAVVGDRPSKCVAGIGGREGVGVPGSLPPLRAPEASVAQRTSQTLSSGTQKPPE